jgi:hypothetical protein
MGYTPVAHALPSLLPRSSHYDPYPIFIHASFVSDPELLATRPPQRDPRSIPSQKDRMARR